MSYTTGRDPNNPGLYSFECYSYDGVIFHSEGGFHDRHDCERAARQAERHMMALQSAQFTGMASMCSAESALTDDEILKELGL